MNCDKCRCKNLAYPIIHDSDIKYVELNCPNIQHTRTQVATYYWCYKGGPPRDGSPSGWYPGRGY